jgi:hypothetical protein
MENPQEKIQFSVSAPVPKQDLVVRTPKVITWTEFLAGYGVMDQKGRVVKDLAWPYLPSVLLNVIGDDKLKARAAAHDHRCWTVVKKGAAWSIEAGMNMDEAMKIGYLVSQNPWLHLDDTVVPS